MMSGSRGETSDAFTSLLGIVGDPAATKKRIEQLQAATKANEDSLVELQTKRAELDTQALEQGRTDDKHSKELIDIQAKHAELDRRERKVIAKEQALKDDIAKHDAENTTDRQAILDHQAVIEGLAKVTDVRTAELDQREADLDERTTQVTADRDKLAAFEEQLHERQADIDKRFESLKALVG